MLTGQSCLSDSVLTYSPELGVTSRQTQNPLQIVSDIPQQAWERLRITPGRAEDSTWLTCRLFEPLEREKWNENEHLPRHWLLTQNLHFRAVVQRVKRVNWTVADSSARWHSWKRTRGRKAPWTNGTEAFVSLQSAREKSALFSRVHDLRCSSFYKKRMVKVL